MLVRESNLTMLLLLEILKLNNNNYIHAFLKTINLFYKKNNFSKYKRRYYTKKSILIKMFIFSSIHPRKWFCSFVVIPSFGNTNRVKNLLV